MMRSPADDRKGRKKLADATRNTPKRKETEEALRESERRLRLFVEHAPASVAMFDCQMRYLVVSRRWMEDYRLGERDIIGCSHYEVFPEIPERWKQVHQRCLAGTVEACEEDPFPRADGRTDWVRWEIHPWRQANDEIGGIIMFTEVITARKEAEEALRQSQQRFQTLAAATFEGIAISEAGRLLDVNEQFAKMFGYGPGEMIGMEITALIAPEDRVRIEESIRANRDLDSPEHHALRKDGSKFVVEAHARNIVHQGRRIRISAVRDITERKRVEESVAALAVRYRTLLQTANDGIHILDEHGNVVEVNDAFCRMLGYTQGELLRLNVADWDMRWSPDSLRAMILQVVAKPAVFETRHRRKDGQVRDVEISATGVRLKDRTYVYASARDITERKRAEEALAVAKTKAEQARAAAEGANTAKDQFLAALSHELRTPLTPVLMLSQMLQDDPRLPEAARQDVKTIRQNVQLEARLIDDLLDLTRVTRGKIHLRPERVDVHELLRHAMQTCCDELFAQKRLRVEWQLAAASSSVWADPARLEQVFWNLMNNAIKFTPPEGAITIRTSDLAEKRISIQIADTGAGIERDKLTSIFNPFEQGGTETTERYGGLGLGLAIAKAVVELHGGQITASSGGSGQGATFTVVLVAASPQETAAWPAASGPLSRAEGPVAGTLRILLVEDHHVTAVVLGRLIKSWGWEVSHAASLKAAFDLAAKQRFDLVISDLGLPDGTGHELMRQLRDLHGLKGIALSGYGMEQDVQRSLESGFMLHLTKPVDFEELRGVVATFVAGAGQERACDAAGVQG